MFGMTELRAGSKKAAIVVSVRSKGQTSQIMERNCASSITRTTSMRPRSAAIMTCLRRTRSLTIPAVGPMKVCGNTCNTSANATDPA